MFPIRILMLALLIGLALPSFALVPLRSFVSAGGAHDLCLQGRYAYVASGAAGLRIFDVSNLAAPVQVGIYNTPGSATGVAVQGDYAYVADGASGLRIINISDPAAPTEVGFYDTPGSAFNVAVDGNYAYVADGYSGSLRIIDVTNPAAPFEVSSVSSFPYTGAYDVVVIGHMCYFSSGCPCIWGVDVTDPVHPVSRGMMYTYNAGVGMVSRGNFLFVAMLYGIDIFDVSNPDAPVRICRWINSIPSTAVDLAVRGNYLFLAYQDGGFQIFDISNPATPTSMEIVGTPGQCTGIVTMGCTAYAADNNTFRLYDISAYAPCPIPRAPAQIVIEPLQNQIRLTWLPVTCDTGGTPLWVSRYTIYRSDSLGGEWDSIGEALPADTLHYLDMYAEGQYRFYQVRAVAN